MVGAGFSGFTGAGEAEVDGEGAGEGLGEDEPLTGADGFETGPGEDNGVAGDALAGNGDGVSAEVAGGAGDEGAGEATPRGGSNGVGVGEGRGEGAVVGWGTRIWASMGWAAAQAISSAKASPASNMAAGMVLYRYPYMVAP